MDEGTYGVVICGDEDFTSAMTRVCRSKGVSPSVFQDGGRCRSYLATGGSADLIMVGPYVRDVAPINLLAALTHDEQASTSVHEGGSSRRKVLFNGVMPSGSLISRASSAGADLVLTLEQAESVLPDVGSGRACGNAGAHPTGKLISVISAQGGSGKTTLSLLCAMAFARIEPDTALVDYDLRFGDLAFLLGLDDVCRMDGFIGGFEDPALLVAGLRGSGAYAPGEVRFFAAPARPERGDALISCTGPLIQGLKQAFALTVMDTGADWNGEHAELLALSDHVLLVIDQRSGALEDAGKALDLCMRLGVPMAHISGVLNRCGRKGGIDELSASVALRGLSVLRVEEGGREVDELVGLGCPQELFIARNPCASSIQRVVSALAAPLGMEDVSSSTEGKLGGTSRFASAFRRRSGAAL